VQGFCEVIVAIVDFSVEVSDDCLIGFVGQFLEEGGFIVY